MEAPADGWYVFLGVGLVSVAFAGIALGLPSGAAPDANLAANTVDEVAGSSYGAATSYEHDAEAVRIGGKQIWLRNDEGTAHASVAFGTMVWVRYDGVPAPDKFRNLVHGAEVTDEYPSTAAFLDDVTDARDALRTDRPEWRPARGTFRVRTIVLEDHRVTIVDA